MTFSLSFWNAILTGTSKWLLKVILMLPVVKMHERNHITAPDPTGDPPHQSPTTADSSLRLWTKKNCSRGWLLPAYCPCKVLWPLGEIQWSSTSGSTAVLVCAPTARLVHQAHLACSYAPFVSKPAGELISRLPFSSKRGSGTSKSLLIWSILDFCCTGRRRHSLRRPASRQEL